MEEITICYLTDQFKLHTWITYTTHLENEFEKKERSIIPSFFHQSVYCINSLICSSYPPRTSLMKGKIIWFGKVSKLTSTDKLNKFYIVVLTHTFSISYLLQQFGRLVSYPCSVCSDFLGFFPGHHLYQPCISQDQAPFSEERRRNTLET